MKISIYDLLGVIKDGKAPKKIMYEDKVYYYVEEYKDYEHDDGYCLFSDEFEKHYGITAYLNDEVEILETTITFKPTYTFIDGKKYLVKYENGETLYEYIEDCNKIEKLKSINADDVTNLSILGLILDIQTFKDKINEIIKKLNKE